MVNPNAANSKPTFIVQIVTFRLTAVTFLEDSDAKRGGSDPRRPAVKLKPSHRALFYAVVKASVKSRQRSHQ